MLFIWYGILFVQCLIVIHAKHVLDVDSSILTEINQNPSIGYLIKFHAPWFVVYNFTFFSNPQINSFVKLSSVEQIEKVII